MRSGRATRSGINASRQDSRWGAGVEALPGLQIEPLDTTIVESGPRWRGPMPDKPDDTQVQRMPSGKPKSDGLANTPQDTTTGTVKPQDGPMDRRGTEVEEVEEETILGNRGM